MPSTRFEVAALPSRAWLLTVYSNLAPCYQVHEQLRLLQGHPVLQHEYDRVKAGTPMEPLDTSRFRLAQPPANKQNDFSAWRKATDNAHSQLEHQYNRYIAVFGALSCCISGCVPHTWPMVMRLINAYCHICRLLNLELLLRFGSNARRRHNQSLEGHIHRWDLARTAYLPVQSSAYLRLQWQVVARLHSPCWPSGCKQGCKRLALQAQPPSVTIFSPYCKRISTAMGLPFLW